MKIIISECSRISFEYQHYLGYITTHTKTIHCIHTWIIDFRAFIRTSIWLSLSASLTTLSFIASSLPEKPFNQETDSKVPLSSRGLKLSNSNSDCRVSALHFFVKLIPPPTAFWHEAHSDKCFFSFLSQHYPLFHCWKANRGFRL